MSSTTSSDPAPPRLHVAAALALLGSGATVALLDRAVATAGPLAATGWWAVAGGIVWLLLAPPTLGTLRDAVVPAIFLALALGLAGYALEASEVSLLVGFLALPLAIGPAISGFLRGRMPPAAHLFGFAAGALAVISIGATGDPAPGAVLAAGSGAALTVVHLAVARVLHRHRAVAHGGATLALAGVLLLAGAVPSGTPLPPRGAWLPLVGAIALGAVTLPLVRVRLGERLTPGGLRPHLPLAVAGALAVAGPPTHDAALVAVALAAVGAWTAGMRPSEVSGAEAFRAGP